MQSMCRSLHPAVSAHSDTSSTASRLAAPTPSWRPRSFTMANSPSVKPNLRWPQQASRSGNERRRAVPRRELLPLGGQRSRVSRKRGGTMTDWLERVRWNVDGLVPAIAQDAATHRVLTLAWMNREALQRTVKTQLAHYWSRSRAKLWRKGE